ncbi:hypothetical protein HHI36_002858 [Cryptolaemus montrouzieri]|uniref:Uncharacterized protein n=1 Tax=Cryptolaemus montrouzieri TaxID=559131 RepID=A0ABD2PD82_9CUCU
MKKKKYLTWLQEYKQQKNEVRRLIKTEENNAWDQHCPQLETLIEGKRCSEVWKSIRSLKSSSKDKDHISIIEPDEWKDHYANLLQEKRTEYGDKYPKENIRLQIEKVEIGEETTKKVVMSMQTGNSSGPEGIYTEMLKNGSEKLLQRLMYVINECLNGYLVPEQWKVAHITSIHKR